VEVPLGVSPPGGAIILTETKMDTNRYFERIFVINLRFKTDRLATFQKTLPKCLGDVEIWPAVHGDTVAHPSWWTSGNGAYGCMRSHLGILEKCYNEGVESFLSLEDDAIFAIDFEERFHAFMQAIPEDWESCYLGGQLLHEHQHPPIKINEHCLFPRNVNRTHAVAFHRRGYKKVYQHLSNVPWPAKFHVDHMLGSLHDTGSLRLYVPNRWLVGQDSGPSNISGNNNSAQWWVDPEKLADANRAWQNRPIPAVFLVASIPAVFLVASIDVAVELERKGWHRGHWQNEQRLDRGVCNALGSLDVKGALHSWYKAVMPEAVREGSQCVCLFHPTLTWEFVSSLEFDKFHLVQADAADDAEQQLATILSGLTTSEKSTPKRNLIYHIWPRKGNGVWQWNVEQLLKRIEQFDGVRSIAVATSDDADTLDAVQAAFKGVRIDNWISMPNNPNQGESTTFVKLLQTIPRDNSITFRGHAKGVKYSDAQKTREWTEMLYEVCLDDQSHIAATLEQYPVAGPFVVESDWPAPKRWHFSGAFFWFRSSALSKPNARRVDENYWGVELWPQSLWERSEVGVLFGQKCARLYDNHELERMKGWLADWKSQKRSEPGERGRVSPPISPAIGPSISIVIPTLGRPTLQRMIDSLLPQLAEGDQIIVVADGADAYARAGTMINDDLASKHDVMLCSVTDRESCYGNAQRNHGMSIASGDLIWFCDDDDIALPGALTAIRRSMAADRTPTMFRMRHLGDVIWRSQECVAGNVAGPQLVIPNRSDIPRFPVPASNPELSDGDWIRAVNNSRPVRWEESLIYQCDGHGRGLA